jgi:hypothetical protein
MNKQVWTRKRTLFAATAVLVIGMVTQSASAAVTVDDNGQGFIGKGDVQQAYGWNDRVVTEKAETLSFRAQIKTVENWEWECFNSNNERESARTSVETTMTRGLVSATARSKNGKLLTGFNVTGWGGDKTQTGISDPEPGTCPGNQTLVVDSLEKVSETTKLVNVKASDNGGAWVDLQLPA